MRYLGVDPGTKRIGLALAESESGIVSPLAVIQARASVNENAGAILDAADEYDVGAIVVGLPLNMDGSEGPQAKHSRSLAAAIRTVAASRPPSGGQPPYQVHLHDERLTSHAADELLTGRELTHKKRKARHDALAAQVLLQSFLESR